jgi:NAD(P)-dependent dehydrogenase (short-subunit alcohol dehydrogenase family)
MKIAGSNVMITGGAIRVGKHQALHMAKKGANIAFSYLPGEPWEETKKELEGYGVRVTATELNGENIPACRKWVDDTARELGRVDVLINSASVWLKKPALEVSEREYDLAVDINMKAPFFLAQAAAKHMKLQGAGVIINITDCSAFQVWPEYAPHGASKAGLVAFTKSLAWEWAPEVRVNAIAPGTVLLPPNYTPEVEKWAVDMSVLGRIGEPEDVARTAAFIIESDYATGAVYHMDGGMGLIAK